LLNTLKLNQDSEPPRLPARIESNLLLWHVGQESEECVL
jgi:hypothetical protein